MHKTEAEYQRSEVEKNQKQKNQRNIIIIIIKPWAGQRHYNIILHPAKKGRLSKATIQQLNQISEIQIAELEERNRLAKEEERQKLGMELHDDLASHLAYLKTKIESEILQTDDTNTQQRLNYISEAISVAYEKTRIKSHQWYNLSVAESELSFKKRIQTILDNGLPDKKYQKEIVIDEAALENIPLNIKIEFLYIIQEAITNILKHAKASTVKILIYRETAQLMLHIADNGKGFDTSTKKTGLGLQSIKHRILNCKGTLTINADKNGTEIIAGVPIEE